jgi:DNA-binding transcriptional regulator YdaS (Cro superfamily)
MALLSTSDAVIDALGGTGKLAARLGCSPSVVSQWRKFGVFPARYADAIRDMLAEIGHSVPPALVGQVTTTYHNGTASECEGVHTRCN